VVSEDGRTLAGGLNSLFTGLPRKYRFAIPQERGGGGLDDRT